jgi:uncharacterized membrane protein YtjA (UPF0391 family)
MSLSAPAILFAFKAVSWARTGLNQPEFSTDEGESYAVLYFLAAVDRLDCRNSHLADSETAELCGGLVFDHHRNSWADEYVEEKICACTRQDRHEILWVTVSKLVRNREGGKAMLSWAITFLIIGLIAGVLGLTGIAGAATQIAWILFVVFLVLFVVSLVMGRRSRV